MSGQKDKKGEKEKLCKDLRYFQVSVLQKDRFWPRKNTSRWTSSFPEKNSSRVSRSLFSPCDRGRLVHLQTWNWASVKYSPRPKRAPVHKTSFSFVSSLPGQYGEKRCHVSCTVALTSGNSFKSSSGSFVLPGTGTKGYWLHKQIILFLSRVTVYSGSQILLHIRTTRGELSKIQMPGCTHTI